jgi:outer membrane assembly lipoprotein YfiO
MNQKIFKKAYVAIVLMSTVIITGCVNKKEATLKDKPATELLAGYQDAVSAGSYDKALEHLREIEAQYPFSNYAQQAMLNTAYVHYKQKEHERAVAAADRFIFNYPTSDNVDYAYYLKGLTYFYRQQNFIARITGGKDFSDRDQKNAAKSYEAFNDLVQRFPDSQYADDAKQKMLTLHDTAARYEMRIAAFYYDRGAYVATINRAKEVLERFPQSLSVEDALGMMALSYQQMGIDDLHQDTLLVIKSNYPNSRYLQQKPLKDDCLLCLF